MKEEAGAYYCYQLDGKGGGILREWPLVEEWRSGENLLWVHLDYRNEKARSWLAEESGLSELTVQSLLDEGTRPRHLITDEGLLLILRGINCNPGSDPEDMVALRMMFFENRIITLRHRRIMAVQDISDELVSGRGPLTMGDFLVLASERVADRTADVVASLEELVDELEESVLTQESRDLRSQLADVRRSAISLRRYIAPQRDVLTRLLSDRLAWLDEEDRTRLREIVERTGRFVEDIDSARERASITLEELSSHLSDQMNRAMYVLSIVAAIFLPLSLLTGLLGINVGGIPGTESKWAFTVVTVGLVTIAIGLVLWFKRSKWL